MTSKRLRDKKSIGTVINDTRSKVQKIQTSIPSPFAGIASQAIKSAALGAGAVDNSSIGTGSITADKLASGSFNPAGQNLQRVPAPLTSAEYWVQATAGNIPTHKEGYFSTKENRNVSSTDNGILFSPESSSSLSVTFKELDAGGAIITTSTAHSYEVGDVVTVSNVGSPFNGTWTITSVDTDNNAFTYNLDEYFETRTAVTANNYLTSNVITSISKASNVITFTTTNSFSADQLVTISNVVPTVYNLSNVLIASANATSFTVYDETNTGSLVTIGTQTPTGTTNISITTGSAHGFLAGQSVVISNVTPSGYNGTWTTQDGTTGSTLVVNIGSNPGAITVAGVICGGVAIARPAATSDDSAFDIAYKSIENSDGVATITTTADHSFLVDEVVTIAGLGSPYDGSYVVTEVPDGLPRVFSYDTNGNAIERVAATGSVKVEAEARLFLTGKHPVPVSKKINISWISSNQVPFYIVYWKKVNDTDTPIVIPVVDSEATIILKQGNAIYEWSAPSEAEYYSVYVEVPANSAEFYLQDCAVFEIVGDKNIKSARISSILIENHVITITTADPHAFAVGDSVTFESADYATSKLNGATLTIATVSSYTTFTLNSSVSVDPTDNALNLPNTSGIVDMTNTLALVTGTSSQQSTEIGASGITYTDPNGGTPINLTSGSDKNFFGIYDNATGKYEATIDENGNAVLSTIQANHLVINDIPNDGVDPITIGSTSLTGEFPYSKYNDTEYTGALLDRLARGIIYAGSWRFTHGQNVDSDTKYFGIAAGTFQLETNRTYLVNASSGGMYPRTNATYGANQDTAYELLVSTAPIEVDSSNVVARISHTVPVGQRFSWNNLVGNFSTYPSAILSKPFTAVTGITGTSNSSNANITASSTTNLFIGRTITVTSGPPGFSLTNATVTAIINATAFTINTSPTTTSNFTFTANQYSSESSVATPGFISRTSPSATATLTVPTDFGQYLKTNAIVRVYRSGGTSVDISEAVLTKVSNTSFTFTSTATSTLTNYLVSVELIDPILYSTGGTVWSHSVTGVVSDGINHVYTSKNVFQVGQQINITGFVSSTYNISNATITAANSTSFTIAPTSPAAAATVTGATATATWTTNQYALNKQYLPSGRTLYWVLRLNHSANTNAAYDIYLPDGFSNRTNSLISIADVGQSKQIYNVEQTKPWTAGYGTTDSASVTIGTQTPSGTTNITITTSTHTFSVGQSVTISGVTPSDYNGTYTTQTGTTGTTLVVDIGSNPGTITVAGVVSSAQAKFITGTTTVNATSTAYYDSYGKGTGTTNPFAYRYSLYQGTSGTTGGVKKSVIIFPDLGISALANVSITKLEVYIHNKYSYYSSGITAYLGAHTYSTLPASAVSSSNVSNLSATTATFARGEGKWVTLPSSWYSQFAAGTAKGVLLGLTNSSTKTWYSEQTNYGYFDGVDPTVSDENFPRLRATYTYTYTTVSSSTSGGSGSGGGFVVLI